MRQRTRLVETSYHAENSQEGVLQIKAQQLLGGASEVEGGKKLADKRAVTKAID